MRYRRLGSSDLEISEISLGSWLTYGGGIGREQAEACLAKAFDVGLTVNNALNADWREAQFAEESRVTPTAPIMEQMHYTPGIPLTATS